MNLSSLAYSKRSNLEHRLIAALLRSDAADARVLIDEGLQSKADYWIDRFEFEVCNSNVPYLIYQRIYELGLPSGMGGLTLSDGSNLLEKLRHRSAQAEIEYASLNSQFLQLLDLLGDLSKHVVWLKGTALSRTIYKDAQQRLSIDFDAVVEQKIAEPLIERLASHGFMPVLNEPGHCHQFGVGPVNKLDDLLLIPCEEYEGCHNFSVVKHGWPEVELKFNPLDTGLKMKELERFFADSKPLEWSDRSFLAPSVEDHLVLGLIHWHKHGFINWGWLCDTHLLAEELADMPNGWNEFVRRCRLEEVTLSAWKGLSIVKEMMNTRVPDSVLNELKPPFATLWDRGLMMKIDTQFVWNCNGLPMLVLNSFCMGGTRRKISVLLRSFAPSDQFLSSYCAHNRPITLWNRWFYLVLHWLILILPAGLIRRTFGVKYFSPGSAGVPRAPRA